MTTPTTGAPAQIKDVTQIASIFNGTASTNLSALQAKSGEYTYLWKVVYAFKTIIARLQDWKASTVSKKLDGDVKTLLNRASKVNVLDLKTGKLSDTVLKRIPQFDQNKKLLEATAYRKALKETAKDITNVIRMNNIDAQAGIEFAMKTISERATETGLLKPGFDKSAAREICIALNNAVYKQMFNVIVEDSFKTIESITQQSKFTTCKDKLVKALGSAVDQTRLDGHIRSVLVKKFGAEAIKKFGEDYTNDATIKAFVEKQRAEADSSLKAKVERAQKLCSYKDASGADVHGLIHTAHEAVTAATKTVADLHTACNLLDTDIKAAIKAKVGVIVDDTKTSEEWAVAFETAQKDTSIGPKVSELKQKKAELEAAKKAVDEAKSNFDKLIAEKNKLVGETCDPWAAQPAFNAGSEAAEIATLQSITLDDAIVAETAKRAPVGTLLSLIDTANDDQFRDLLAAINS